MKARLRRTLLVVAPFLTGIAVALTLFACCCPGRVVPYVAPTAVEPPPVGLAHFDVPADAAPQSHTQVAMRNVHFRLDNALGLQIEELRGEMYDRVEGQPLNLDDKRSFIVGLHTGRIGIDSAGLTDLVNRALLGEGSSLRSLAIRVRERRLEMEGVVHKVIDIPFQMTADVSLIDDRWLRIHPIDFEICNLDGRSLMRAFGVSLDEILTKLPSGMRVDGSDLLIEPLQMVPPPTIQGRIASVELRDNEMEMRFDDRAGIGPLSPPAPEERNWMFFQGGTLRMGKLFMARADMQVVDCDPRDPFDFSIDHYNAQLIEGFTRNLADYGLKVFMRDFHDVKKPRQPGERLVE